MGTTRAKTAAAVSSNGAEASATGRATNGDSAKVQDALYRIAEMASAASDMAEFYAAMHHIVGELMYATNFYIALYDEGNKTLNYPYYRDQVDKDIPDPEAWEPMGTGQARGLTAFVLRTGQPQLVPNMRYHELIDSGEVDLLGVDGEDWLGVPLRAEGRTIGVLVVQTYERGQHYSQQDVEVLTYVGQHVASALSRARAIADTKRLLAESNQRAAELETVNSISQALAAQLDLEALIELVGERTRQTFNADIVYVALLDEARGMIDFPYYYEVGSRQPPESIKYGEGWTSQILQSCEPLLINSEELRESFEELALGTPTQSYLGVPILIAGEAIGVIAVESITEDGRFGAVDARLLATIAASVGAAIQNARLYRETRLRASEMAALVEVSRQISATLDPEAVLHQIAEQARELLEANTSAVYLADSGGRFVATVVVGDSAEEIGASPIVSGEGIIGDFVARAEAGFVNDVNADPRAIQIEGTAEEESERLMIAPLHIGEQVIGMTAVWRSGVSQPFVQENLDFLVGLSQQAAVAITNARLYEEAQAARAAADKHRQELARFLPSTVAALMDSAGGGESGLLAAHRRDITAIFCDLRGFTSFTQEAEPEEVLEVLAAYQRCVGQLVLERGGTLEHYAGDGIFGFLNDPEPVPDHPLVGVSMALEMQRRFTEIAEPWRRRGFELGLGIGLSSGYATVGRVGFEGYYLYAAIGSVANLAARLCAVAESGQVVISGRTYSLVESAVDAEPLGSFELKGFNRPVEAFSVERLAAPAQA